MKITKLLLPLFASSLFAGNAMALGTKWDVLVDCGADPSGATDSTTAIQNCINSAGAEAAIYFPAGLYKISSTLTVHKNFVTLYGDTYGSALLEFNGCGDMIKYQRSPTDVLYNGGMRNLLLRGNQGNGNCSQTGIEIVDGSWLKFEDVQIAGFEHSDNQSIGIKTNGREGLHLRDIRIEANYPIVIDKNPAYMSGAADHFHFENLYTTIRNNVQHWHITLLDEATVSNMTIDGQNPMVGGCGILQWLSPNSSGIASFNLKIANTRHEQSPSGCDKKIDIELPASAALQSLVVDNVTMTVPTPYAGTGIYLENVRGLTVRDTKYWNPSSSSTPATFIDASGMRFIELQNNHVAVHGQAVVATDDFGVPLAPKSGPFTGKECCWPAGQRTMDSGIFGQP